jgi:hypothetical protein
MLDHVIGSTLKNKYWYLSFALALGLAAVLAVPTLAGGLTVFGGKVETSAQPGREYYYSMKVENTSDASSDVAVEIKGYGTESENPFVVLDSENDTSHHSARQYLAVAPSGFKLGSGESRDVVVSANIPAGTEAGGKYAIVYIHTVPKTGSVATTAGMAARVLLTVDGSELSHTSQIVSIELSSGTELLALVGLINDGNQHYKPHLRGTLSNGNGILASASIDDSWPVIPHYSRQIGLGFRPAEPLPAGEYNVDIEVLDESEMLVAHRTVSVKLGTAYSPHAESPVSNTLPLVKNFAMAPVTTVLKPSVEAELASEGRTISISFPQGAVLGQVPLTLKGYQVENTPAAPKGYSLGDTCFRVDGLSGLLAKEATLTVKYGADDLASAGGEASRLVLARLDENAGGWTVVKTKVDLQNMTLTVNTNHFSTWAVMVRPASSSRTALLYIAEVAAVLGVCATLLILTRRRRLMHPSRGA